MCDLAALRRGRSGKDQDMQGQDVLESHTEDGDAVR